MKNMYLDISNNLEKKSYKIFIKQTNWIYIFRYNNYTDIILYHYFSYYLRLKLFSSIILYYSYCISCAIFPSKCN